MTWAIVVQGERADYGEDGMDVYWEVEHVIGPFTTQEAADEYERVHFLVAGERAFTKSDVVELEVPA